MNGIVALLLGALLALPQESASELLVAGPVIELPGVEGRIDHLAVDLARQRLFVAALGNDTVEVLDLAAGKRVQSLHGPEEPQGILYLADLDRMVVASGRNGTCEVYDGETLKPLARVPVGADADNLRYDPDRKRLYVAHGEALGILDAETWTVVARIPLEGHPEGFQLAADGRRAFVNVPGARHVAVVDLDQRKVSATWRLDEAGANYPMALVPGEGEASGEGLLLVGCRTPARLVVRAQRDGARLQALELSGDPDDLFLDARHRRVYAACGAGFVDLFELGGPETGADALRSRTRVATAPGARTCLFVPERGELFVAVPHRGAQRAEVRTLRVREP